MHSLLVVYNALPSMLAGSLVTLGNVALKALAGPRAVIGDSHGKTTVCQVREEGQEASFPLFPLYHPASIIYNRSLTEVYQQDLACLAQAMREQAGTI